MVLFPINLIFTKLKIFIFTFFEYVITVVFVTTLFMFYPPLCVGIIKTVLVKNCEPSQIFRIPKKSRESHDWACWISYIINARQLRKPKPRRSNQRVFPSVVALKPLAELLLSSLLQLHSHFSFGIFQGEKKFKKKIIYLTKGRIISEQLQRGWPAVGL